METNFEPTDYWKNENKPKNDSNYVKPSMWRPAYHICLPNAPEWLKEMMVVVKSAADR